MIESTDVSPVPLASGAFAAVALDDVLAHAWRLCLSRGARRSDAEVCEKLRHAARIADYQVCMKALNARRYEDRSSRDPMCQGYNSK